MALRCKTFEPTPFAPFRPWPIRSVTSSHSLISNWRNLEIKQWTKSTLSKNLECGRCHAASLECVVILYIQNFQKLRVLTNVLDPDLWGLNISASCSVVYFWFLFNLFNSHKRLEMFYKSGRFCFAKRGVGLNQVSEFLAMIYAQNGVCIQERPNDVTDELLIGNEGNNVTSWYVRTASQPIGWFIQAPRSTLVSRRTRTQGQRWNKSK